MRPWLKRSRRRSTGDSSTPRRDAMPGLADRPEPASHLRPGAGSRARARAASLVDAVKVSDNKLSAGFIGTMPVLYVLTMPDMGICVQMVKEGGSTCWLTVTPALWASRLIPAMPIGSGHTSLELALPAGCTAALPASPDLSGPGYAKLTIKPAMISNLNGQGASRQRLWPGHQQLGSGKAINWRWRSRYRSIPRRLFMCRPKMLPRHGGGIPAAQAKGVKFLGLEGGAAVYEVGSGRYSFLSKR